MPRYAARIAPDEIKAKLLSYLIPRMLKEELCEQEDLDDWDENKTIIAGLEECATKVFNDLCKINFSLENMTLDSQEPFGDFTGDQARDWLGPQAWGDLTIIGFMGGGDWESPVAFVVYYDGKDFRGYVPTEGNSFDVASKSAIGSAPAGAEERKFDVEAMKADVLSRIAVR